jgi:hypothetical protein
MNKKDFFPPRPKSTPTIYAYVLIGVETHKGLLKIGYTDRDAKVRVKEQLGTVNIDYKIVFEDSAMRGDGTSFSDHDLHRYLRKKGIENPEGEWFCCSVNDLRSAMHAVRENILNEENRSLTFTMRPEQQEAVKKNKKIFQKL